MAKYVKRPIKIEAVPYEYGMEDGYEIYGTHRWTMIPQSISEIAELWKVHHPNGVDWECQIPFIETLEGRHYIRPTDMIITGVEGERYPCKLEIFKKTYKKSVEVGDYVVALAHCHPVVKDEVIEVAAITESGYGTIVYELVGYPGLLFNSNYFDYYDYYNTPYEDGTMPKPKEDK